MRFNLLSVGDYQPTAVYYEESDSLEYLRVSSPAVYRRIDAVLTLVLSLEDRSIIGFKIKGFKNFYIRHVKEKLGKNCPDFIELVDLMQDVTTAFASQIFEERQRNAYHSALEMAAQDKVHVRDLPRLVG
ncbi:hypothetical protein RvVAT039_00880 [Agrobacterium vitis]|uniref:hypothetical protein n=1 Tax=Agrobacterium vitis TaxID=373 RepID=UPI0015DB588B|nr:hypothetical protein [Agrobacterium vitis]BCH62872.1 hypothetical protein RvVAT039_00880 [Agrobacterium vitis]